MDAPSKMTDGDGTVKGVLRVSSCQFLEFSIGGFVSVVDFVDQINEEVDLPEGYHRAVCNQQILENDMTLQEAGVNGNIVEVVTISNIERQVRMAGMAPEASAEAPMEESDPNAKEVDSAMCAETPKRSNITYNPNTLDLNVASSSGDPNHAALPSSSQLYPELGPDAPGLGPPIIDSTEFFADISCMDSPPLEGSVLPDVIDEWFESSAESSGLSGEFSCGNNYYGDDTYWSEDEFSEASSFDSIILDLKLLSEFTARSRGTDEGVDYFDSSSPPVHRSPPQSPDPESPPQSPDSQFPDCPSPVSPLPDSLSLDSLLPLSLSPSLSSNSAIYLNISNSPEEEDISYVNSDRGEEKKLAVPKKKQDKKKAEILSHPYNLRKRIGGFPIPSRSRQKKQRT